MINPDEAAKRCRCQDPEGRMWIYLNPFCRYRAAHRPWESYGPTHNSIMVSAAKYAQQWLRGDFNDTIAPQARPGARSAPVAPRIHGDPAQYTPAPRKALSEPWSVPVMPEPIVRAVPGVIEVTYARTRAGHSKVKAASVSWPGHDPQVPAGALGAIRKLSARAGVEVAAMYARGFASNADGTPARAAIWEHRVPDETDPRVRVKIGERDPEPVDSIMIRGVWRLDGRAVRVVGGWWTAGSPDFFQDWTREDGLRLLGWSEWSKRIGGDEPNVYGTAERHTEYDWYRVEHRAPSQAGL